MMKIVSSGIAVETCESRPSNAFAGICVLGNGRWLCDFRSAPTKIATVGQKALITWSDDEGKSWSEPIEPFTAPAVKGKPGIFRAAHCAALGDQRVLATLLWMDHSDPGLPYFNEKTEGLLDTKIFFSISEDSGATWSDIWSMDTTPFNQPTPITGPILLLPGDEWACQFELNKTYYETEQWRHSSVIMFSRDQGRTWPEYSITSNDPQNRIFYWDQRPSVLRDGRLLDLFWTYENRDAVYLNIHGRESLDNGRTWSGMWDTQVPGQPAPPVSLPDGRIVMVYVERSGAPVVKARMSSDNGRTWPDETEIIIHHTEIESQTRNKKFMQDAWSEMARFSVGLPDTAVLSDNEILASYYVGNDTDHTDVAWVRIKL